MNKIPCTSQNTEAKTLPTDVYIFGCFGQLTPTAVHSADCWFDSRVKWWILVSFIFTYLRKNSFLLCWNCLQKMLWIINVLFFDQLWANAAPTLNTAFSDIFNSSAISRSFNLWSAETSLWSFLVFSETTAKFRQHAHSALFVSVRPHLKSAYNRITLIEPLLCLNSFFPHQKAMLYQHTKFRFFHCFENLQQ